MNLFKFIGSLDLGSFGYSVIFLALGVIAVITILRSCPLNFKIGKIQLASLPKPKRGLTPPHVDCAFRADIEILDECKCACYKRIVFIQEKGIVKIQMKKVEIELIKTKQIYMDSFAVLVKSLLSENEVATHSDYLSFVGLLDGLFMYKMKDKMREIFVDSDIIIPKVGTDAFEKFVSDINTQLYNLGSNYLDSFYTSEGKVVSRDRLRKMTLELRPCLDKSIRECLNYSVNVYDTMKGRIRELEKEIQDEETKILGYSFS